MIMGNIGFPRSVLLLFLILNTIMVCFSRVSVRVYYSHFNVNTRLINTQNKKKLILIGAGRTEKKIAREVVNNPSGPIKIIGFVDDDPNKIGKRLHGIKVIGNIKSIIDLNIPFDELLICAPAATSNQIRRIVDICKKSNKKYKTVPSLIEMIDRDYNLASIRNVSYVDLLGRKEVKLDKESILRMISGKRILISGAGGSIGSELVTQCLAFNPSEIICFDNNEEKVFKIGNKKLKSSSKTVLKAVLGSVNNFEELRKSI